MSFLPVVRPLSLRKVKRWPLPTEPLPNYLTQETDFFLLWEDEGKINLENWGQQSG